MTSIHKLIEARRADKEDEGGFTLIELLIVIVVLGILAAIVVFAVQNLTKDSAASACKADAKTIEVALEAYKAKVGAYPAATDAFIPITATLPGSFVGVGNYIRSAPSQSKYVIGLQEAGTTNISNGLVYVKSATAAVDVAVAGTEFNVSTGGGPCVTLT